MSAVGGEVDEGIRVTILSPAFFLCSMYDQYGRRGLVLCCYLLSYVVNSVGIPVLPVEMHQAVLFIHVDQSIVSQNINRYEQNTWVSYPVFVFVDPIWISSGLIDEVPFSLYPLVASGLTVSVVPSRKQRPALNCSRWFFDTIVMCNV